MLKWKLVLNIFIVISLLGIFLPLIDSTYWFIRAQNYFKLQYLYLAIVLLIISTVILFKDFNLPNVVPIVLLLIGIVYTSSILLPHSRFYPKEIKSANAPFSPSIKLLIYNVLQDNDEYALLIEKSKEVDPDVLLLLETNQSWADALLPLNDQFPHLEKKIQEDTYGMMLYSKFDFIYHRVQNLYKKDIPSIEVLIKKDNIPIRIMCIHPEPPVPGESKSSKPKDKELLKASKKIDQYDGPALNILAGDMNDVAWSNTAKKIKKRTDLKDPRVGRGTFNTFPTYLPFKIPIDLVFCSDEFELINIEVLENIGSDHHPILIELKFPNKL